MLSRREFLNATVRAGVAGAILATAEAQTPQRFRIVDSQVHIWKAESEDWKWVPGAQPQLREPFTIEKLVPLMDQAGVERAVLVPPGWTGDRNDYALEGVRRYPHRFGVMGRIAVRDPDSAALLPKWKSELGMLGVRLTFLGPSAAWLTDGSVDWFWPAAERARLPVMLLAPGRTADLAPIAERHPELPLIVDHMGVIPQIVQDGKLADTIDQTVALAKYPNVSVKLSALVANSTERYPFRDLLPHVERTFNAFGPQRCYFGTDLTNEFNRATYAERIAQFTEEMSFLSAADQEWVMGRAILARLQWA
jgi:predicted TIM-barrel fold metal-dependent hydrolase